MAFDPEAVRAFEHARWQRAAAGYGGSFAGATVGFVDALLDAARVQGGARLLDLCCGTGVVTAAAAARGAQAAGLDFSPAMLAVARAAYPGVTFLEGDAEAVPLPDDTHDAVVANFGIHHVPRPDRALAEAYRVLRHGGRVAFSFWAEPAENVAWDLLFRAVRKHGDPAASTAAPPPGGGFGTVPQCLDALRAAGFNVTEARLERRVWRHADAAGLVAALRAGTARMAAMIEAQPTAAMPAVLAEIDAAAEQYRDADGIALPIAAVVASGVK